MDSKTQLLKSKILGGVYGQALGDAFCMPAMLSPEQTRHQFPVTPTTFVAAPDIHEVHVGLPAGKVTDDTEQAMWLARQIIAEGKVSLSGAAKAIVGWYDFIGGDTVIFVGPSTRRAVNKMKQGANLNETGIGGDTNGAAMRVSVVGLIHPGDVEAAAHDAAISAMPTHNTSVACASAAAVAGAVAFALGAIHNPNPTPPELRDLIFAGMHAASIGATLGRPWLGASIPKRIEFAVSLARDGAGSTRDRLQAISDLVGTSLAASEAVPAAFGIVALAEGDPLRAAQLAFELSGDADTVGAIACAICGAWKGVACIPAELCEQLRTVNPDYDFDRIAKGLLHLALGK